VSERRYPDSQIRDGEDSLFRIVLVCTGNRCRSPVAKALLERHGENLPIDVRSVGLLDLESAPVLPEILELGSVHGLDLGAHRSSHIEPNKLSAADLVLGLERQHVAAAVVDGDAAPDKTFTLRQFVQLSESLHPGSSALDDAQLARQIVGSAHRSLPSGFRSGLDVTDPFGGPRRGYEEMFTILDDLSLRLLRALFPHAEVHGRQYWMHQ
jgi:protein-tyrosine phosphatase